MNALRTCIRLAVEQAHHNSNNQVYHTIRRAWTSTERPENAPPKRLLNKIRRLAIEEYAMQRSRNLSLSFVFIALLAIASHAGVAFGNDTATVVRSASAENPDSKATLGKLLAERGEPDIGYFSATANGPSSFGMSERPYCRESEREALYSVDRASRTRFDNWYGKNCRVDHDPARSWVTNGIDRIAGHYGACCGINNRCEHLAEKGKCLGWMSTANHACAIHDRDLANSDGHWYQPWRTSVNSAHRTLASESDSVLIKSTFRGLAGVGEFGQAVGFGDNDRSQPAPDQSGFHKFQGYGYQSKFSTKDEFRRNSSPSGRSWHTERERDNSSPFWRE